MKIDYNNKTVECSQKLLDWRASFGDKPRDISEMLYKLARIGWGYHLCDAEDNEYPEFYDEEFADSHHSLGAKMDLMKAIIDGYEFKLEEPKVYHWRKRKEYLAWFETGKESYLNKSYGFEYGLDTNTNTSNHRSEFTEEEAREILKGDFDKFERVEIE